MSTATLTAGAIFAQIRRLAGGGLDCDAFGRIEQITPVVEAHPLGMLAVKFVDGDRTFRLHVWTPETQRFRDDWGIVHDHVWHLRSRVLRGAIQETRYSLERAGDEGSYLWYHNYRSSTLVRAERHVHAVVTNRSARAEGSVYRLRAGSMHSAVPCEPVVVTLVVAQATDATAARIVGGPDLPRAHASRSAASLGDVVDALRSVA